MRLAAIALSMFVTACGGSMPTPGDASADSAGDAANGGPPIAGVWYNLNRCDAGYPSCGQRLTVTVAGTSVTALLEVAGNSCSFNGGMYNASTEVADGLAAQCSDGITGDPPVTYSNGSLSIDRSLPPYVRLVFTYTDGSGNTFATDYLMQ